MIKRFISNTLLVICSIVVTLIIIESVIKLAKPYTTFGANSEIKWMRESDASLTKTYTLEEGFGFRPILNASTYSQYGTLRNEYPFNKGSKTRLLFIGDSVTARGKIMRALAEYYGNNKYEYWNAGVESFNTLQEVAFYKKYNQAIEPDHVILTFHQNDYTTTPIAFFNKDNKLVVYAPNTPLDDLTPWLYKNSVVYRLYIRVITSFQPKINQHIVDEIKNSLQDLNNTLAKKNIRLSVILLPHLDSYPEWSQQDMMARSKIKETLDSLDIVYYDLLEPMNNAVANNINLNESPGDTAHPSSDVANVFAQYLYENNLLGQ